MRNRLLQLLADNRRQFVPMRQRVVTAAQGESNEATIYLYDAIVSDRISAEWFGGVCPQDFVPAVRGIKADVIHLRINSPGGDVFGAEAMCQALRDQSAHVVAHIEGLAASAATSIACACDEVVISSGSKYMIHNAWTLALGNAADMRAMADLLDKCDESMVADYARRSGNDLARIVEWCKAETWFTSQEAVDAGFADSIAETTKPSAQARGSWNLRAFTHTPADPAFEETPTEARVDDAAAIAEVEKNQRAHQHRQVRMLSAQQIV